MNKAIVNWTPPPMRAGEQVLLAQRQLDLNRRDLVGSSWAIHPLDLSELRRHLGAVDNLRGLYFTIAADVELAGVGPRLVWEDEWPESWIVG